MKTKRKLPGIKALREKTLEINRTYTHSDLTTEKPVVAVLSEGTAVWLLVIRGERRDIYAIRKPFFKKDPKSVRSTHYHIYQQDSDGSRLRALAETAEECVETVIALQ